MHKLSFIPGQSLLHRLYPVTKLVWLVLGTILVFLVREGWLVMVLAGLLLLALFSLDRRVWQVRGFRFAALTGLILWILYLLFNKSGSALIDPGIPFLTVTSGGLAQGLLVSGRFMSIIFLSYLFILSTEPNDLAYALMQCGFPYRIGFMLVTALRLSPILEEEGHTIYQAQLVRGVRYDQGGAQRLILLTRQFLTPVLIGALQRADKLVFSMEGRGFGQHQRRTFRRPLKPTRLDIWFNLGLFIVAGALLYLGVGGNQ